MSDSKDSSGVPGVDPADDKGSQHVDPVDDKPDTVSRRAYSKALSEKRAAAERAQKLEAELEQLRQAELEREGDLQKSVDYYKEQAAKALEERDGLVSKYDGLKGEILNAQKKAAIRDALPGPLKSESYWDLVDTTRVVVDPEGKIDHDSVKQYAVEFSTKHPELIQAGSSSKVPNENPPGGISGKLTVEEWRKLPYEEKKARKGEVLSQL